MKNTYNLDDENDPVSAASPDDIRGVGAGTWRRATDEWIAAAQRQQEEARNAALAEQISSNRGVYDGYAQMGNTVAARKAQFMGNANAHLASSLRLAAENGGRLPQYAWQGLGGALGLDGKGAAIVGGGFDKKGGFMLAVARKNPQTGQVEQTPMSFTPQQQYSLMLSAPGIFSRQEVEGMRGQLIDNFHMHPDQVPQVPQGWGEAGNVGVDNRAPTGGVSVPGWWLYGPQRRANISAFGANGRGGFTNYDSNDQTGYQLVQRDSGTRAEGDKGRWKVLSRGADPNSDDGTQVTRYENDKTGEVVSVRDGETPPWELRAAGEKERIAQIQENAKNDRASAQNETRLSIADLTAQLKQQGYDVDEKKLAEAVRHHQAVEAQQSENEKGRADRAKEANETKRLLAEFKRNESALKGRRFTANDYVGLAKLRNEDGTTDEQKADIDKLLPIIAKSLGQQGVGVPNVGKTEVKRGDNGNGGRTITRGQLDRAVKAGATYDEKTGILKTKDGRTMKIAGIQD